jgi:hypothetical protein
MERIQARRGVERKIEIMLVSVLNHFISTRNWTSTIHIAIIIIKGMPLFPDFYTCLGNFAAKGGHIRRNIVRKNDCFFLTGDSGH